MPASVVRAREVLKQHAIALHQRGDTILEVCRACGLTEDTLEMWRREEGLIQPKAPPGHSRLEAYTEELKQAWFAGQESLDQIGKRYGTTGARISTFAKSMGWPRRSTGALNRGRTVVHRTPQHEGRIRAMWDAGLSQAEIGRRIGVTAAAIRALAQRRGWPERPDQGLEKEERVFQLAKDGLPIRAIARNLDMGRGTVVHVLRRLGLYTPAGEASP